QGAMKVKEKFPEAIMVFLLPPSLDELKSRITGRGTESVDTINTRMNVAVEEMSLLEHYDYAVLNDQIDIACDKIRSIIIAENCRTDKLPVHFQSMCSATE